MTVYLVVEDDGAVVDVVEVPEGVFDVVFAGADAGGEAGVEGAVDGVWSEVLGAASFFSPVVGAGASLPADGFILSE
jgi:type IV secretory pathway VirB10-like protein